MAKEWVTDDSGDGMWLQTLSKNKFTGISFSAKAVENIPSVSLRADDILMCSYAKTGAHWIWENLRILLTGEIKLDNEQKESSMMELDDDFVDIPSPRILNNHCFFEDQPKGLLKGGNKVVIIYRNPKDVALSMYHHNKQVPSYEYNGIFSNFQKRFIQGKVFNNSYFEYLRSWEEGLQKYTNIPHLLVRYEDFHENPISERRRLANFIGREYDDAFLQDVTDATSIDTMRRLKSKKSIHKVDGFSVFYRKGKVGDWKDNFTVAENEWFDSVVEKEMKESKLFSFKYLLD